MFSPLTSRRAFLSGLAMAGAGALASRRAHAQPGRRVIDLHHHFTAPGYLKALAAKDGQYRAGFTPYFNYNVLKTYSPAKDIELMDMEGVQTSVLSCTTPGIWFGDPAESSTLAREMNEYATKMASDYKGRFGLFAVLPLPVIDASLKEIEYALDTLKADGVGLMTSYGNRWLGDPTLRPIFDELNRRKAVVYTHPIDAPCCSGLLPGVNPTTIEFGTDTARTIYSLIAGEAAARYSDIKFVFSHAGGTMPSLVERFGIGGPDTINDNLAKPAEPNSRLYHLRRFYYDTAQAVNVVNMQGLKRVVSSSQIVFGTDFPFVTAAKTLAGLDKCGFSPAELTGIHRETALKLVPRFK
ncbi:MAG: amidohydrolase family protein [Bryobacteraceae bacterium]